VFIRNIWDKIKKMEWASSWLELFFNPADLRSFQVFCGEGEERPFYIKREFSHIQARATHNLKYFYLNYLVIAAFIFGVALVLSSAAMVLFLLSGAWTLALKLTQDGPMTLHGAVITQQMVLVVLGICTLFILSEVLAKLMSTTVFFSVFVISSHALLRDETSLPAIDQSDSSERDKNTRKESINEKSSLWTGKASSYVTIA